MGGCCRSSEASCTDLLDRSQALGKYVSDGKAEGKGVMLGGGSMEGFQERRGGEGIR